MSQKVYLFILKLGVFAGFLSFFMVFKDLLFPFITSKQIYFNVLIEILVVFWLAFIIKYPSWNPFKKKNKNLITWGVTSFFGALLLSLTVTVDFNMSFWGDIERMLGIFHLLHFLVFYFIIITVMKNRRDWKMLLIVSVVSGFLVAMVALGEDMKRLSTIGNAAYVAGLMIFNIYFALILFIKEKTNWKWLYLVAIFVMLGSFRLASISGAYVGLGFSIMCFFLIFGVLYKGDVESENKDKSKKVSVIKKNKLRIATLVIFVLLAGTSWWVLTHKDHPLVADIKAIQEISISKNTFQTRLISWRGAVEDFKNHPLLGVGHGNYSVIFDKYFDPSFFDYTRIETYFDRAHNNVIDIASTTGLVGILTYLSIFVFLGYYLIIALIKKRVGVLEFSLLSALTIAYFVQNLAVFDSLVTYVSLIVLLGYVHWLANNKEDKGNTEELINKEGDKDLINKEIYTFFGIGILMFIVIWNYNILPYKMLQKTIDGQRLFGKDFAAAIDAYRDALKYNTPLDRDSRFTLVKTVISGQGQIKNIPPERRDDDIEFIIEQAEKNLELSPSDSLLQMQLARTYDVFSRYHSDAQKRKEYTGLALKTIEDSIAGSPGRIPIYFIKAQILINAGNREEAINVLENAISLNENFYETYCQLGQVYLMLPEVSEEDESKGIEYLGKCVDNGAYNLIFAINAIKRGINHYAELGDSEKVIKFYEQLVRYESKNPQNWINLAKLYEGEKQYDRATSAAAMAVKADKSLQSDVDEFIKAVKMKKDENR